MAEVQTIMSEDQLELIIGSNTRYKKIIHRCIRYAHPMIIENSPANINKFDLYTRIITTLLVNHLEKHHGKIKYSKITNLMKEIINETVHIMKQREVQ